MTRWQKAVLVGCLAAAACLGAVAWSSARQLGFRRAGMEEETRLLTRQFAVRLRNGLEKHLIALEQMATFFENSEEVSEEEFQSFAATTLRRTPPCLRISVVDPSFRVRRVHPLESNRAMIGLDVRTIPLAYQTLFRAMKEKEAAVSPPLELVGGAPGFFLAAPMFRRGTFIGLVTSSFRSEDFFALLVLPEVLARYEERVEDAGVPIFATASFKGTEASIEPQVEGFELGGRTWTIRVHPKDDLVAEQIASDQLAFWIIGCLLAVGVGSAAGLGTFWASEIAARLRSDRKTLRETRERLDGAMEQLFQAEKMTALGELVAGVAHEVNNPLASIMGYSQLALTRDLPAEVRRFLETACSEAERAGKIVRNLLTFARKQSPEKKYLGLNGIIEKTLELKAYHFRTSQVEVEKVLATDLPMTMLDFHQIQQVLLNLMNNAEQAMLEAGRGGRVRVTTRRTGGRIEARLSDTGPGIPPEVQGRIFDPFFTTKKEGKGTGLGLSVCYGIIKEHGGQIRVESEPGKGATFILDLPIVEGPAAALETPSSTPPSTTKGLRILVIDDEPSVQRLLVDLLTTKGHRVDTASDVPDALKKIAADGHDLILSDMKMPHGTGRDIYAAVVTRSPRLARRIVFTTGDGGSAETQRFIKETGNEVLLKPCKIEEIEKAIVRAMSN